MHGIKYFFSIKIIRQSRGAKKFSEGANYRKYYLKTLLFKIQKGAYPWIHLGPPLLVDIFNICAIIDE
jgi:hypothetical protein